MIHRPNTFVVLCLFAALSLAPTALAPTARASELDEWGHWRGPLAAGVAPSGDPPVEWDAEKNVQWKVEVPGSGNGTPTIWGDRLFLLTAIDTGRADPNAAAAASSDEDAEDGGRGRRRGRGGSSQPKNIHEFVVMCLDRHTGEELWRKTAAEATPHERLHPDNTHASGSAITDGQRLFASFGSHGVFCYDLDGNQLWERDLGDMQTRNEFGEGASPALHGSTLVVNWDHEGPSKIFALDASNGEILWQNDRDELTTWNTPLVVEAAGRTQVIVNATGRTRSYDLQSGELIWECGGQVSNPIPSPVAKDGVVYCMSGYRGSAVVAIPLDSQGDVTDSESLVWRRDRGTPYVPSPLLYGDRLYFTKSNDAILSVLDANTGAPLVDQKRLPGLSNVYASPVGAAGRVYITGRDGTTLVIRDADELEVLATNRLDEPVDASPAIVDDCIYVRGERNLYCISNES